MALFKNCKNVAWAVCTGNQTNYLVKNIKEFILKGTINKRPGFSKPGLIFLVR
jgi:hypothetical protein